MKVSLFNFKLKKESQQLRQAGSNPARSVHNRSPYPQDRGAIAT